MREKHGHDEREKEGAEARAAGGAGAEEAGRRGEGREKKHQKGREKPVEVLLEEKTDEAARNYELFLRARADLENMKKRQEKEKAGYMSYATECVVLEILPAIDNLERALEHASSSEGDNVASLVEGVRLTIEQMRKALAKFGVKEIKALGQPFDPSLHHAISHEDCDDVEPGMVIKEFQKGYLLKDKLLRPSIVAVAGDGSGGAKKPGSAEERGGGEEDDGGRGPLH